MEMPTKLSIVLVKVKWNNLWSNNLKLKLFSLERTLGLPSLNQLHSFLVCLFVFFFRNSVTLRGKIVQRLEVLMSNKSN